MEIINHRRKMLDSMESSAKGNDNVAIKVNIFKSFLKKKLEAVRTKNQTYFFHFRSYLGNSVIF